MRSDAFTAAMSGAVPARDRKNSYSSGSSAPLMGTAPPGAPPGAPPPPGGTPPPPPPRRGAHRFSSTSGGAPASAAARAKPFALLLVGAVLGFTVAAPMILGARRPDTAAHLGPLPGHDGLEEGHPGHVVIRRAAPLPAYILAAMDAAASNLTAAGASWLGPYSLAGPAGEAALARAREARSARRRERVGAKTYVIDPEPLEMRAWHKKVRAHIESRAFRARVAARRAKASLFGGNRGIIINAGGRKLLTSAAVTLAVLRRTLNCSLPVELVWHGKAEMDRATLKALDREFGPLRGYNIEEEPFPSHHRSKNVNLARFEGKVFSLLHSHFTEAILLDCDNIPFVDPAVFFEDLDYRATGNLFWPDFWAVVDKKDIVFDIVGLDYEKAAAALAGGKGRLRRDTESGALLIDLARHADVIEYAAWINTFSDIIYKAVWGDKDTYSLAFAVAGKADEWTQVQVPPGAALTWRPKMLAIKKGRKIVDGWQLAGMLQFDSLGRPAFLHRTLNKFWAGADAWPLERLTGPLPYRWVHYYLAQDTLGPTVGVPYDYVVPESALVTWTVNGPVQQARVQGDAWSVTDVESCPVATFADYRRAREAGLPLGRAPALDAACAGLLPALVGKSRWPAYRDAGFASDPELLHVATSDFDDVPMQKASKYDLDAYKEVGDGTPVPAWAPDYNSTARPGPPRPAALETSSVAVLRAQYEAFNWVRENEAMFPVIAKGP